MRKWQGSALAGFLVAGLALLLGLVLEGGRVSQVLQPTAAIIVLGGTFGAVLVQFPMRSVRQAFAGLLEVVRPAEAQGKSRMDHILRLAMHARRHGLVSLDPELKLIEDPFFTKALMLAIDGIPSRELRDIMELELARAEEEAERGSRVWEAAGGFAPTIGILGAVLGLIQVMQRLDDISLVGRGIAVAFVATLYGVGLANLVFLPLAGNLRLRAREAQLLREATLEGVISMVEGISPRALREKLGAHAGERASTPVAQMATR